MRYKITDPDGRVREVISDAPMPGMMPPALPARSGPIDTLIDWLIGAAMIAVVVLCVAAAGTFALWAWRALDPPREVQGTIAIVGGVAVLVGLIGTRDTGRRTW